MLLRSGTTERRARKRATESWEYVQPVTMKLCAAPLRRGGHSGDRGDRRRERVQRDEPDIARHDLRDLTQEPVPRDALAEHGRERSDARLPLLRQLGDDGRRGCRRGNRRVLGLNCLRARAASLRRRRSRTGTSLRATP